MNNSEKHEKLKNYFKVAFQKKFPKARIFDRTVGLFYRENGSPIRVAKKGMADCYALIPCERRGLLHFEFEIKTGKGRLTEHQRKWQAQIREMGGMYLIVRDVAKALIEIEMFMNR